MIRCDSRLKGLSGVLVAGFAVAAALTAAVPTTPACIETVHEAAVVVAGALEQEPAPSSEWGWEIRCGEGPHWGLTGRPVVSLWPDMAPSRHQFEDLVWHELGHVWAYELERVEKVRWMLLRGYDWEDDWGDWRTDCTEEIPDCYESGAEDWSESFSHCRSHRDPDRHWEDYGPVPTDEQCAVMDSLLAVGDAEDPEPGAP